MTPQGSHPRWPGPCCHLLPLWPHLPQQICKAVTQAKRMFANSEQPGREAPLSYKRWMPGLKTLPQPNLIFYQAVLGVYVSTYFILFKFPHFQSIYHGLKMGTEVIPNFDLQITLQITSLPAFPHAHVWITDLDFWEEHNQTNSIHI